MEAIEATTFTLTRNGFDGWGEDPTLDYGEERHVVSASEEKTIIYRKRKKTVVIDVSLSIIVPEKTYYETDGQKRKRENAILKLSSKDATDIEVRIRNVNTKEQTFRTKNMVNDTVRTIVEKEHAEYIADATKSVKATLDEHIAKMKNEITSRLAHQQAADKHRASVFATAKETGEPQVLSHYMAECNDPDEQCSLDSVTVYALPDGKTKAQRQHTW